MSAAEPGLGVVSALRRVRILLLAECGLFGLAWMLGAASADSPEQAIEITKFVGVFGVTALGLQLLLLLPIWRPRARRARGVPVWLSLAAGAALTAALLGGFVAALVHAFEDGKGKAYVPAGLAVAALAWLGGTVLFVSFLGRRSSTSPEWIVTRLARGILKGTAFEALAVLPLDLMIRKKSDCYCVAGSVLAWATCVAVGVIVFGPAALLPALARQRDRHYAERCDGCGARLLEASRDPSTYRESSAARCGCGEIVHAEPRRAA